LTVPYLRTLYRPTQTWSHERQKLTLPRLTTSITSRNVSVSAALFTPEPRSNARPVVTTVPYSALTVGVPRETYTNERRVAITPQNAALLLKKGFERVLVERGAGAEAQFTDQAYEQAGVMLVDRGDVWSESDILLKVRAPSMEEIDVLRRGGTIISFLYPAQNRNIVEKIASREATSFAMDMIPRISRAQVFDALRCVSSKHCISHIVIVTILQFDGQHRWVQSGGRSL
jgi:H+-translocating NAD(P) transhydrogenase